MTSNLPELITSKLTAIESLSEKLMTIQSDRDRSILHNMLNDFFALLPEIIEHCEIGQVINVIELFHLFCAKYRFDDILDTGIYYTIYILYFKAYTLQHHWVLDQLSECYSEMEDVFERFLNLESPNFLKSNSNNFLEHRKFISRHVINKISISPIYFETLLQHTALLSQKGSNLRAKEKSEKCYKAFTNLFRHLNNIFGAILMVGPENIKPESGVSLKTEEIFRYIEFIKTFSIPPFSHIEGKWSSEFTQWRFNKDYNDKFILKTIEAPLLNQSLKQKINKEWISMFHISSVVKLARVADFTRKLNSSMLDDDLVLRFILTFSCCIFSLAAENRFIVKKEILGDEQPNPGQRISVSQELKLQKNTQFIYSEKVHLKSIELLILGFDNNIKLVNHFLNSYKKNYSFNVLVIEEVNESCFSSARNSEYYDAIYQKSTSESQNIEYVNQLNNRMMNLNSKDENKPQQFEEKPRSSRQIIENKPKHTVKSTKLENKDIAPNLYKTFNQQILNKTSFSKKSINENISNRPASDERLGSLSGRRPSKPPSIPNLGSNKKISIDKIINNLERSDSKRKHQNNGHSLQSKVQSWRPASKNTLETSIKTENETHSSNKLIVAKHNGVNRHGNGVMKNVIHEQEPVKDIKESCGEKNLGEQRGSDYRPNYASEKAFRF